MKFTIETLHALMRTCEQLLSQKNEWQRMIHQSEPKATGCGIVYEISHSTLANTDTSVAIVDMQDVSITEPHYHPSDCIELYIILQGAARVFVGRQEYSARSDDIILISPGTTHFAIPDNNCIIGAINTPPYRSQDYIPITESSPLFAFDKNQYTQVAATASRTPTKNREKYRTK